MRVSNHLHTRKKTIKVDDVNDARQNIVNDMAPFLPQIDELKWGNENGQVGVNLQRCAFASLQVLRLLLNFISVSSEQRREQKKRWVPSIEILIPSIALEYSLRTTLTIEFRHGNFFLNPSSSFTNASTQLRCSSPTATTKKISCFSEVSFNIRPVLEYSKLVRT